MIVCGSLIILLLIGLVPLLPAQVVPQGKIAIAANGGYSVPLLTLGERFKGTYNIDAGINYGITERLGVEVRLVYGQFNKMSTNGRQIRYVINQVPQTFAMNPAMEQYLKWAGLTSSMTIGLTQSQSIKPYLLLGTGVYRTDHFRGAARPYVQLYDPGNANYQAFAEFKDLTTKVLVTPYQAKHRTNYAWGINGGLGLAFPIGANASIDIKARYEVIMSDLWAAIFLGMEGVRPIQNLQLTGGIKFNLR